MNPNDTDVKPTTEPEEAQNVDETVDTSPEQTDVPVVVEESKAEPQPTVAATVTPNTSADPAPNAAPASSGGLIVLQWLTYAFWGWLILGLIWLMSVLLVNFILNEHVGSVVPYAIAATVVLLPIAFFTDRAYRKHEPLKKTAGASVVMIIHAVLFALLGIGTLIAAVFILLNLVINGQGNNDSQIVAILTAAFAAVLYAAAFLRTLNPFKSRKPLALYSIVLASLSVLLLVLAVIGPVVSSVAARNDQRLEQSLPTVDYAIRDYIRENNQLPASLDQLEVNDEDAQAIIDEDLVSYEVRGTEESTTRSTQNITEYRYELCASFNTKGDRDTRSSITLNDGYVRTLNARYHDEGRNCFKLLQTVYESDRNL